jgi:sporulation protein YlmC with PRC-barrel domain
VTESFRNADGRKVVSRASAEHLGTISHLIVDAQQHHIASVVIGKGKKAQLVDWAQLSGFGPDAVVVVDDGALRTPIGDRERAAADGQLDLVGKRALTDRGNRLGTVDDVIFDPDSGDLDHFLVGERQLPPGSLLGYGSFAAVFDEAGQPPT